MLPKLPPLGKDLFGDLSCFDTFFRKIDSVLQSVFCEDFEKGMRGFIESKNGTNHYLIEFMQKLALYFLQFKLNPNNKESNLYIKFVRALNNTLSFFPDVYSCTFATLNYDLLLDDALQEFDGQPAVICKPHGAPNWLSMYPCSSMKNIKVLRTDQSVSCFHFQHMKEFKQDEAIDKVKEGLELMSPNGVPAMCVYEEAKESTINNDLIANSRKSYKELIVNAHKIIIIGIKYHPADEHIWEKALDLTNAQILYIEPYPAPELKRWIKKKKEARNLLTSEFSACIKKYLSIFRNN